MKRIRWTWPVFGAILLVFESGCLVVHNSTRIVRENEPLRAVRFESEQAQSAFEAGVNEAKAHKKSQQSVALAVPFLCLFGRSTELSDNAVYNDEVVLCDADGDNVITEQEASAYRARLAERRSTEVAQARETVKSGGESETVSLRPPESARRK